jgi:hypothetical protein
MTLRLFKVRKLEPISSTSPPALRHPLKEYIEEWFVDQAFIGKTVLQQRKAFTVLEEWCNANRKAATLAYA